LLAEGQRESLILQAEGHKKSQILQAEADKEARIRKAEGEAEAILKVAQAQADGLRALKAAEADNSVLTLKAYEALAKVADGKATKLVIPSNLQGLAGLATTFKEAITEVSPEK
jgi:regulator of protease activity HflC (stomatin/prohibitin superfamily)